MNSITAFHSFLAEHMQAFVAFKRMQGYDYTGQARTLSYFDAFLVNVYDGEQDKQCLSLAMLQQYVRTTAHLKPFARITGLSSLREFSRYLHAKHPQSVVLPMDIVPRHTPTMRFYRIELGQVSELMAATRSILPAGSIRAHSTRVLIGVLYSTGLRINEALQLTLGDLDEQCSTLHIVKGKFGKQRLVPISPSTRRALNRYLSVRSRHASTSNSAPVFIGAYDKALRYDQAYDSFVRLCQHCGLNGDPLPRLHDLRHNYACRRLELWRQEGADVNAMLPILATAMGHVNFLNTQKYLHVEPCQLHDAAALVQVRLNHNSEPQK